MKEIKNLIFTCNNGLKKVFSIHFRTAEIIISFLINEMEVIDMENEILILGSFMNLGISKQEIDFISDPTTKLTDISNSWEHIKNWSCGSYRAEAKEALFTLMQKKHENGEPITDQEKLDAFNKLEKIIASPFKNHCDYQIITENKLQLAIQAIGFCIEVEPPKGCAFKVMNQFPERYGENYMDECKDGLIADLPRAKYTIDDFHYSDNDSISDEEKERCAKIFLHQSVSHYQQSMIGTIASQSSVFCIRDIVIQQDPRIQTAGNDFTTSYKLKRLPSGDVMATVHFEQTISEDNKKKFIAENIISSEAYQHIKFEASFIIGKESTYCIDVNYSGEEYAPAPSYLSRFYFYR